MNNKAALVTGGAVGIGRGIAAELAKAGFDIALHYNKSVAEATKAAEKIREYGVKCVLISADISKADGIKKLFSEFNKSFDRLDLYVNNAGITKKSSFLETTEEDFDLICNVDFKGAYFCMQNAAKIMIEKGIAGNIVVISSNNAYAHFADVSVYGSVKAALSKLSAHIAIELAKYNIRVNCIAPGWTDTGAERLDAKEKTYYKIPLKRWTTPEEIGRAVLFLAGKSAMSITGASLVIDGGALLVSDKAERYGY